MRQLTVFVSLALLLCVPVTVAQFGETRLCQGDQATAYSKLGETLAKEFADEFVSYEQFMNATSTVTGNATFEPICMRKLIFYYQYHLRENNVSNWGFLLASLERTVQERKSICQCLVEQTLSYFSEQLQELGSTPSKEAIASVLQAFGYVQHPNWYLNCPVLEHYLHRVVQSWRYQGLGRLNEKQIEKIKEKFEYGGQQLIRPLLRYKIKNHNQNSFLNSVLRRNQFYCFIYNSSVGIFAKMNDTLGKHPLLFLAETLRNETGYQRLDASCLNSFLEEYGQKSDALGIPMSMLRMLEGLYRNNQLLSTVTDYDNCGCRTPSLGRKLDGELPRLGTTPNEIQWNQIMNKYRYIPWATDYRNCPILEWYLQEIGLKYGLEAAERRFLEVGFNMTQVLHSMSIKLYWR